MLSLNHLDRRVGRGVDEPLLACGTNAIEMDHRYGLEVQASLRRISQLLQRATLRLILELIKIALRQPVTLLIPILSLRIDERRLPLAVVVHRLAVKAIVRGPLPLGCNDLSL